MPRAGLDQNKLVHAAIDLVNTSGLDQLTIQGLARHLGVKAPSLYNHIGSLDVLRREISIQAMRKLHHMLLQAGFGTQGAQALYKMAHALRCYAKTQTGMYQAAMVVADADDREWMQVAYEPVALLARVFELSHLDKSEQIHAIRAFRSMLHGFIDLELRGGFKLATDVDASFEFMLDQFLRSYFNSD